ncbi:MAG TPA: hypothetical protein VFV10_07140 [Gammaproteobacteria bacterium]|nr:hypothetical protein [Gammaproteobacteria bacterium]
MFFCTLIVLAPRAILAGESRDWLSLMQATAGATYERRVLDASGNIIEREVFEVGHAAGGSSVPLTIVSFGKDGEPEKTTKIVWRQGDMPPARFMGAAIRFGDSEASIETDGPLLLYPSNVDEPGAIGDVELKIRILKGLLTLLGTRTKLELTHREVEPLSAAPRRGSGEARPYRLTTRIAARVFVLAIPVKRVEFETLECVEPSIGLIRHEIDLDDGTAVIMERIASSGAGRPLAQARSRCGRERGETLEAALREAGRPGSLLR